MTVQQGFTMLPTEEAAKLRSRGPLPAAPYHDPDWWELERKAIWLRSWLHIGHVCEIPEPGSFIRREVEFARASLLIVRGKDGEVRAFHNACTHRGTQLTQDEGGRRSLFSCPYHMWSFGLDGQLVSAPDFERFYVEKKDCALKQVRTEVLAGMIFVNFDPAPAQTAREFFGPLADEMEQLPVARAVAFTEWTYEIAANWKTNFDNFQENYHLRFIHPNTGAQAIGEGNPMGYPTHYGFLGPHRSQTLWKNPSPPPVPEGMMLAGRRAAALVPPEGPGFAKTDFKLFPALHVVGLPPNQYTHTHWPLGPSRTRGVIRMYWTQLPDTASRAFAQELAMTTVRDVLSEDRPAVEAGQRGLESGAIAVVHMQDHEMLPRHLYETVQAMVADWQAQQAAAQEAG